MSKAICRRNFKETLLGSLSTCQCVIMSTWTETFFFFFFFRLSLPPSR